MKKFIVLPLFFFTFYSGYSQLKIGIRFGGAVSTARIRDVSDTLSINKDSNTVRPLFGLTVDLPIKDNVTFSSGISYAPKKASIEYEDSTGNFMGKESYRLQYLQIPLLIRFSTNEIVPGLKVFFTTGFAGEIKVFEESNERDPIIVQKFRPIDVSFNLGAGVELSIGPDTIIYGGLTYYRGLINSVKDVIASDADLKINNDLIGIEIGVRF